MVVGKGRGYATASENRLGEQELGVIPIDSIFSPVVRVRFKTEYMRVGQRTNYDRLILEIWTNGTIQPEDALVEAGLILRKHLNPFVMYHDLGDRTVEHVHRPLELGDSQDSSVAEILEMPVSILNLSVRATNCLDAAKISTVRELVARSEPELLRFRSFGKTSLHEVHRKLADLGLSLGMAMTEAAAISEVLPAVPAELGADSPDTPSDADSISASSGPMEAFTMGD